MLTHGFTVPGDVPSAGKAKKVLGWAEAMEPLEKVIASVKSQMHLFASRVLVEAQFSETSKTIFERYQATVDRQLTNKAAQAFQKLPYVFE
jgi:CHASE1-domain containing sensor protein